MLRFSRLMALLFVSFILPFLVGCALNQSDKAKPSALLVSQPIRFIESSQSTTFVQNEDYDEPDFDGNSKVIEGTQINQVILPVEHTCSDHVTIHVASLTEGQMGEICQDIKNTEEEFHQILSTHSQPVNDDVNDLINVYVFDGYKHYIDNVAKVSGLSNNPKGGYFYEGNPFNDTKKPAVYLFVSSSDVFSVWNLKHEFTHYLNARFVKYGHVKDSALYLFWEEGLAEFIAKKETNNSAMTLAKGKNIKTLSDIFDVTYADGSDDVYLWSYLGIRYLVENQIGSVHQIIQALRNDDDLAFRLTLKTVAESQDNDFQLWLKSL